MSSASTARYIELALIFGSSADDHSQTPPARCDEELPPEMFAVTATSAVSLYTTGTCACSVTVRRALVLAPARCAWAYPALDATPTLLSKPAGRCIVLVRGCIGWYIEFGRWDGAESARSLGTGAYIALVRWDVAAERVVDAVLSSFTAGLCALLALASA